MVEDLLFLRVLDRDRVAAEPGGRELALGDKTAGRLQQAAKAKVEKPASQARQVGPAFVQVLSQIPDPRASGPPHMLSAITSASAPWLAFCEGCLLHAKASILQSRHLYWTDLKCAWWLLLLLLCALASRPFKRTNVIPEW